VPGWADRTPQADAGISDGALSEAADGGELARVPQSIEVGPVFSSDGETLVSDLEVGDAAPSRAHPAAPTAPVLWCVSADDPRCAPRDEAPGDGPRAFDGSHGASAAAETPRFDEFGARERAPLRAVDAPRAGVRARVDRPPQG